MSDQTPANTPDEEPSTARLQRRKASDHVGSSTGAGASPSYEVVSTPEAPALPGRVVVGENLEELHEIMASDLIGHSLNCVRSFGDFHLALSGGSTPVPFYRHLMTDPICRGIPWSRTHLWVVDERRVPFDDERSNWRMIEGHFGVHSGIPREQQHPIFALSDTVEAEYELTLRTVLEWREKGQDRLDYVLLGMGPDGHTASLFPHSPALEERTRLVRINDGPTVTPPDRVTMTYPLLNAARFAAVLVTGQAKRPILEHVLQAGRNQWRDLPILGIQPVGGALTWYLDRAACPGQ